MALTTNKDDMKKLALLLGGMDQSHEVEKLLVSRSNLPGPAGNLTLAAGFADLCAARGGDGHLWELLLSWTDLRPEDAPTGNPREFLPFCALHAMGALYPGVSSEEKNTILARLKRGASDPRWRVREAVAMGFQHIGEWDFEHLMTLFRKWMSAASLTERRCIVAALAHPPMITVPERATECLKIADDVFAGIAALDRDRRTTEDFRILKKGMEYCVSVYAARDPGAGFALMKRWLKSGDRDIIRIIRANLGKARLAKKHEGSVKKLLVTLGELEFP